MKKVSLVKCTSYEYDEVKRVLLQSFENLGGVRKFISKGMNVALKPNLLMPCKVSRAATTNPMIVHALADIVQEAGASVSIVESPGGPYIKANLKAAYKACGMEQVAEKTGIALNYNLELAEVKIPDGVSLKKVEVLKPLVDADLVINLPKLKTHGQMLYTGAVKNMFGAIPGAKKAEYHFKIFSYDLFANALIDIFLGIKPGLSIMDAVIGMDGAGPSAGNPKELGFIAASENVFNLDYTCLNLVGAKPMSVPVIKCAVERGICPSSINEIEYCGEHPGNFQIKDFEMPQVDKLTPMAFSKNRLFCFLISFVKSRIKFNHEICVGCEICSKNCPAKVIKMVNNYPEVDMSKCIRCFCCQELCPKKAVTIKRLPPWIQSVLNTLFLLVTQITTVLKFGRNKNH